MFRKISILFFLLAAVSNNAQVLQKKVVTLMGSRFDITIVAKDKTTALAHIDTAVAEITRIENLISDWIPETQVSEINRNAGIVPVKVDRELLELTQRAIHYSKLTDGAFDISFAAADKIWKFDGSMETLPSEETIRESVKKIGYKNIVIDTEQSTIFLKLPGMKIGFGSIGKGYAADKAKELLVSKGVAAGIINASGDMNTWGKDPNGKAWTVGITNPMKKDKILSVFPISDRAVVTSGNYEKFVLIGGKRYAHIIDPRTGWPAAGISSVTVFAENAEMANGLSTAIVVLGKDAGLKMVEQFPLVRVIIIDDNGKVFHSKNIKVKKYRN